MFEFHSISSVPGPHITCESGQGSWIVHVGHGGLKGAHHLAHQRHEAGVVQQSFLSGATWRYVAEQRHGVWGVVEQPGRQ